MRIEHKLAFTGALAILALEAVSAWLSALERFPYVLFGVMVYGLVISLVAFLIATLRNNRKTS